MTTNIRPVDSTALVQALKLIVQEVAHTATSPGVSRTTTGGTLPPTGQSYSGQPSTGQSSQSMLTTSQDDARTQELRNSINQIAVGAASGGGAGGASAGVGSSAAVANPAISAVSVPTAATLAVGTGSPLLASPGQIIQPGLRQADTSTRPVPGTGAAVVAKPTQATYLGWQNFATQQTHSSYQTNAYPGLAQNKAAVNSALQASGASPQESALVMASGMMETANMSAAQADQGGQDGNAGPNMFNMNIGMLHDLGYQGNGSDLSDPSKAVPWMVKAIRTFGPQGFLAYHRGGVSGYMDGHSGDVASYVQNASRISNILMAHPEFMTNNQRIE